MAHAYLSHRHGCINLFAKFQCTRVCVCANETVNIWMIESPKPMHGLLSNSYLINFAFDISQHPSKLCVKHRFFSFFNAIFCFAFTYFRAYACNLVQHHVMHFMLSNISVAFPYCFCSSPSNSKTFHFIDLHSNWQRRFQRSIDFNWKFIRVHMFFFLLYSVTYEELESNLEKEKKLPIISSQKKMNI